MLLPRRCKPVITFCGLSAILFTTLPGCSGLKEQLGLNRRSPDEFAVVRRAPLEMPPDMRLPEPTPGAPRPQELSPAEQAKATLLGGDPAARPVAGTAAPVTQTDNAFLNQLGAAQANPAIRAQVDTDAVNDADQNRSAMDKLMGRKGETAGQVLNPLEENQRLQKAGAPVPNVPADYGKPSQAPASVTRDLVVPPIAQ